MKKTALLFLFFCFLASQLSAQTHRRGHGAASVQELSQSVFNALKENQFGNLQNYLPDEVELRVLRRRSSVDMRALLDQTSPDSLKQSLQSNFNAIIAQTTANTFNWHNWQPADIKATQADKKNRALYRVQVNLADLAGNQSVLLFEAIQIRNRYFLFKQMVFKPVNQPN